MARNFPAVGICLMPWSSPNDPSFVAGFAKSTWHATFVSAVGDSTYPTELFYDIQDRTYTMQTRRGRTYELGRAESGEARLAVDNSDRLFDPYNTSSPLYGYVTPYKPLIINCAHNGATGTTADPLTGNFINDTNAAAYQWTNGLVSDSAVATPAEPISVTLNDSNFESSATTNWWRLDYNDTASPTFTAVTRQSTTAWQGTYAGVATTTASTGAWILLDVPLVAGQTYVVSAYVSVVSGTGAKLNVWDGAWYPTATAAASSASMSGTTYTRYSVSFTASSPRATIGFTLPASGEIRFDGIQVEIGTTASTYTTTGPTVYSRFTGFVERYPMTFQAPNRGEVNLIATDQLASMSQVFMDNLYVAETLLLNPYYYYPLSSEKGSTTAANLSAYNQPYMSWVIGGAQSAGKPGSGDFGDETAQQIVAAGTNGAAVIWGANDNAPYQYLTLTNIQDLSWIPGVGETSRTYTFEMWFKLSAPDGVDHLANAPFVIPNPADPAGVAQVQVYVEYNAVSPTLDVLTSEPTVFTSVSIDPDTFYGSWHHIMVSVDQQAGSGVATLKSVLDGGTVQTDSGTVGLDQITQFNLLPLSQGSGAHFAVYPGDLTAEAAARYEMGLTGYAGEALSARFERLFGLAGFVWPMISAQQSVSYAGAATGLYGQNLFDASQSLADTEASTWSVAGNGTIVFNNRRQRQIQTTYTFSFADNATGNQYMADQVTLNNDPTFVLNDITVTRAGGVTSNAYDSASVVSYFPRTYSRTIYNTSDLEAIDCAFYLLDRYKNPVLRIESFTLSPAANPSAWAAALGVDLDDLIEVSKAQFLAGTTWDFPSFVERIEDRVNAQDGTWETSVVVSPQLRTYNFVGAFSSTLSSASIVGATSLSMAAGTYKPSNLTPGQLLEVEPASTANREVMAVAGVVTGTTTLSVPINGVDMTAYGVISDTTVTPDATTINLSTAVGLTGATRFIVKNEIIDGSILGNVITATTRGSQSTQRQQFVAGDIVYKAYSSAAKAHANGSTVSEYLALGDTPTFSNDLLQSMSLTVTGAKTTTGAYTALPFAGLLDYNNAPSSDFTPGQVFLFDNGTTTEYGGLAAVGSPNSATGVWSGYFYPLTSTTSTTLSTALGLADVTVVLSAAAPAGTNAIIIDTEWMQVTAGAGTATLTVTRGTPNASVWDVLGVGRHIAGSVVRFCTSTTGLSLTYAAGNTALVDTSLNTDYIRLAY